MSLMINPGHQQLIGQRAVALLFTRDLELTALAGPLDPFFIVPTNFGSWMHKPDALAEVGALLVDTDTHGGCTLGELKALVSSSVPVIAITGAEGAQDRAVCLKIGAMDAISKPAEPCELRVRLSRFAQRPERSEVSLHFARWVLFPVGRRLFSPRGRRVDLTEGMTRLLCCFFERPEQPLMAVELSKLSGRKGHDRGAISVLVCRTIRRIQSTSDDTLPISRVAGGWVLTRAEIELSV